MKEGKMAHSKTWESEKDRLGRRVEMPAALSHSLEQLRFLSSVEKKIVQEFKT